MKMRCRKTLSIKLHSQLLTIASAIFFLVICEVPTAAGNDDSRSLAGDGRYAGFIFGTARSSNSILDIDGFANWGNPGWKHNYSDQGAVGGVFFGRSIGNEGLNLRYELEAMLTDFAVVSNQVDPRPIYGGDETVVSKYDWTLAAKLGIEKQIGGGRLYMLGGPALAQISNSVSDLDYNTDRSDVNYGKQFFDSDDSFSSKSTRFGLTLGFGFEKDIAPNWSFRLEAAVFDFGSEKYRVNYSGDDSCGRNGPKTPCDTYLIDNSLTTLRLGFVYHFGS